MGIIEAIVQGVVQGLTEFLPVSSSGHLALSQHILGVTENNLFFDIMLHLGTLIAVLAVYYKLVLRLIVAFFSMIGDIFTGKFKWNKLNHDKRLVIMLIIGLVPLFCLFIPIPGLGLNLKDVAENLANSGNLLVVGLALLATSGLLTLGIKLNKQQAAQSRGRGRAGKTDFTVADSLYVGFTQLAAAIFPGLSRSGSTLAMGLMRGISKQRALDYSFILAIPSILAAALLELKDVEVSAMGDDLLPLIIGMVVSAIVGFLAIKLFKWLLATDKMSVFVWYTFILGTVTIVVNIIESIRGVNLFTGAAL